MTTEAPSPARTVARNVRRMGDVVFSGSALTAGTLILAVLAAVSGFLILQSIPAFTTPNEDLQILRGRTLGEYVLPLILGTLWSSFLALLMAVPLGIGIALFISHYAPRRLASGLGYVIDLLAAVPSVVFGLWGANTFAPAVQSFYVWLNENVGWLPFFSGEPSGTGRTMLTAAIVLAVMILPVITAICREVFLQTPVLHEEAALALGATRWEMIRMTVFPFARAGIISGAMLGLGRALGETMAVAMVLSASSQTFSFNLISSSNVSTIPANIALSFAEAFGSNVNVLIATGLILFAITLLVNMAARIIINRRKEFSGAN